MGAKYDYRGSCLHLHRTWSHVDMISLIFKAYSAVWADLPLRLRIENFFEWTRVQFPDQKFGVRVTSVVKSIIHATYKSISYLKLRKD